MQLLALLCSKAIPFSLSPDKNYTAISFPISNSHAPKIVFLARPEISVETIYEPEPSWSGVKQTQAALT